MSDALERVEARAEQFESTAALNKGNELEGLGPWAADLRALCAAVETLTAEREAVERGAADRAYEWLAPKLSPSERGTLDALVAHERLASVAARDAAWREAVARVRDWPREFSGSAFDSGFNAALDAVLAAMEGK